MKDELIEIIREIDKIKPSGFITNKIGIYDVKDNLLIMYLLADIVSKGYINIADCGDIFMKYLEMENYLIENFIIWEFFCINNMAVYPCETINRLSDLECAVMSAYRILCISKISEICGSNVLIRNMYNILTRKILSILRLSENNKIKSWQKILIMLSFKRINEELKRSNINEELKRSNIKEKWEGEIDDDHELLLTLFFMKDHEIIEYGDLYIDMVRRLVNMYISTGSDNIMLILIYLRILDIKQDALWDDLVGTKNKIKKIISKMNIKNTNTLHVITLMNIQYVNHIYEYVILEMNERYMNKKQITVNDLIELCVIHRETGLREYSWMDLRRLSLMEDALRDFNKMRGLADIKQSIINNVLYYMRYGRGNMNIILYESQNFDKTLIKIPLIENICKIYKSLGIINKIVKVCFSDFIANMNNIIEETKGGILIIDEIHNSKEIIDVLSHHLERQEIICIISGYEEDINNIFKHNGELQKRFPFVYKLEEYNIQDMIDLFCSKLKGWTYDKSIIKEFLSENINKFRNLDNLDNYFLRLDIAHNSMNMFSDNRVLTKDLLKFIDI